MTDYWVYCYGCLRDLPTVEAYANGWVFDLLADAAVCPTCADIPIKTQEGS